MKNIKKSELVLGLNCVVNDLDDATIYIVTQINDRVVQLNYKTELGEIVSGGQSEISLLYHPNQKQIKNNQKLLENSNNESKSSRKFNI